MGGAGAGDVGGGREGESESERDSEVEQGGSRLLLMNHPDAKLQELLHE